MWGNDPLTLFILTRYSISMTLSNAINEIKNQISSDKLRLYVAADKTRLFEILANLHINAIKLTKKGNISISADVKDNNYVIIAVKMLDRV